VEAELFDVVGRMNWQPSWTK